MIFYIYFMICKYLFYQSDGTRKRNKKIRRVQKLLVSRQIALNTRHLHFLEIIVFPDHLLSYVTVTHLPNISTPNTLILIYVIASFCLFQIIGLSIHLSMSIKSMTMNLNHCGTIIEQSFFHIFVSDATLHGRISLPSLPSKELR